MRPITAEIEIGMAAARLFDLVAAEWEDLGVSETRDSAGPARLGPGFRTRWPGSTLALPADLELQVDTCAQGRGWRAVSPDGAHVAWEVIVLATSAHTARLRYRLTCLPRDRRESIREICFGRRRRSQCIRQHLAQLKVRLERADALRRLSQGDRWRTAGAETAAPRAS